MNPAVEYLESPEYLDASLRGRFAPRMFHSEFHEASVVVTGGVTASRPMFELIADHENVLPDGTCYVCRRDQEPPGAVVPDGGGILSSVSAT